MPPVPPVRGGSATKPRVLYCCSSLGFPRRFQPRLGPGLKHHLVARYESSAAAARGGGTGRCTPGEVGLGVCGRLHLGI